MLNIKSASRANGRQLLGVCAGLSQHFKMDVSLLRIIVVLSSIVFFPLIPLGYLILALIMEPEEDVENSQAEAKESDTTTGADSDSSAEDSGFPSASSMYTNAPITENSTKHGDSDSPSKGA